MKILLVCLLSFGYIYGEYKNVSIGSIDRYYKNKITKTQIHTILIEIQSHFKQKLGFDVFGITPDGKDISLLYVKPSLAQKRLKRYISNYEKKEKKLYDLEKYFPQTSKDIKDLEKHYNLEFEILNDKIKKHNNYLKRVNQNNNYTKKEYDEIKGYDKKEQMSIKKAQKAVKSIYKKLKSKNRHYNRRVIQYNNTIKSLNSLSQSIENLSRSLKVVKGNAIFNKYITKKTYAKDGVVYKIDIKEKIEEKIEIYGFSSRSELKAVLAHEIAHLVGIPHINIPKALMNPILQENQKKQLNLTPDDIEVFQKYF